MTEQTTARKRRVLTGLEKAFLDDYERIMDKVEVGSGACYLSWEMEAEIGENVRKTLETKYGIAYPKIYEDEIRPVIPPLRTRINQGIAVFRKRFSALR